MIGRCNLGRLTTPALTATTEGRSKGACRREFRDCIWYRTRCSANFHPNACRIQRRLIGAGWFCPLLCFLGFTAATKECGFGSAPGVNFRRNPQSGGARLVQATARSFLRKQAATLRLLVRAASHMPGVHSWHHHVSAYRVSRTFWLAQPKPNWPAWAAAPGLRMELLERKHGALPLAQAFPYIGVDLLLYGSFS
jgi:hypothetical protein